MAHSGDSESVPHWDLESLLCSVNEAMERSNNKMRLMCTWRIEPGFLALCLQARKLLVLGSLLRSTIDSSVELLKARLVAKEFLQCSEFDYVEAFARAMRTASICTLLALAALNDLDLRSLDISNAHVNGTFRREIYMQQPDGSHFGPGDVLHLVKSLYELKQAGQV